MEQEKKEKKLYQKWWAWVIAIIIVLIAKGCISDALDNLDNALMKEIPNVMGVNHTDAVSVLESKGFKVTEIETDAESVLSSSSAFNRSVKKGDVFKINDELSPNYIGKTKDKKVVIYYAKDDYVFEEPESTKAPENTKAPTSTEAPKKEEKSNNSNAKSTNDEEWRQFLKDYEAWADKCVEIVKKYTENPNDISIISDYGKLAADTVRWSNKAQEYQDKLNAEASPEVLAEYIETLARVTEKLASVVY